MEQVRKLREKVTYTSIQLGCIMMGIHMLQFDPCLIWYAVNDRSKGHKLTCDLVFLYFIFDFQIEKKIVNKLQPSQTDYLKRERIIEPIPAPPTPRKAKPDSSSSLNSQLSSCQHYFLGEPPIDEGCR